MCLRRVHAEPAKPPSSLSKPLSPIEPMSEVSKPQMNSKTYLRRTFRPPPLCEVLLMSANSLEFFVHGRRTQAAKQLDDPSLQ